MRNILSSLALVPASPPLRPPSQRWLRRGRRERKDTVAYTIVADLTSEVGQRLGGTPREAYARDWAVKRLTALGLTNPHIEPYTMPGWERGAESAVLLGAAEQKLAIAALGNSGATPASGIKAPMVYFASYEALKAAPDAAVKGKIVFIDNAMRALRMARAMDPMARRGARAPRWRRARARRRC
jgi:hypothetical protein